MLSDELISRTAKLLDVKDRCAFRGVNKKFHNASQPIFESLFNTCTTDLSVLSLSRLHSISMSRLGPHVKTLHVTPRPDNPNGNKIGEGMDWSVKVFGEHWVNGNVATVVQGIIQRLVTCDGFIISQVGADHGKPVQQDNRMVMKQVATAEELENGIMISDVVYLVLTIIHRLPRRVERFTVDLQGVSGMPIIREDGIPTPGHGAIKDAKGAESQGWIGFLHNSHGIDLRGIVNSVNIFALRESPRLHDPFWNNLRSPTLRFPIKLRHTEFVRLIMRKATHLEVLVLSIAEETEINPALPVGPFLLNYPAPVWKGYFSALRELTLHGTKDNAIHIDTMDLRLSLLLQKDELQKLDLAGINLIGDSDSGGWNKQVMHLCFQFDRLKEFRLARLQWTQPAKIRTVASHCSQLCFHPSIEENPNYMVERPGADGGKYSAFTTFDSSDEWYDADDSEVGYGRLIGTPPGTIRRCKAIRGVHYDNSGVCTDKVLGYLFLFR